MILNKYQKHFSQSGFSSKVLKVAKRVGSKLLYPVFVLYNAYKSKEVSVKDKAIIIGALGYFILPKDLISDFLPIIGFTDDFAVLTLAIRSLRKSITPEIKEAARQSLNKLLGSLLLPFYHSPLKYLSSFIPLFHLYQLFYLSHLLCLSHLSSEKSGWQHQKKVVTFKNFFIVLKIRAGMLEKLQRVAKNLGG